MSYRRTGGVAVESEKHLTNGHAEKEEILPMRKPEESEAGSVDGKSEDLESETACDELRMVKLSQVEPEEVRWLWENRFPLGKLSAIHGDPSVGKTFLGLEIIAHVTTGRMFADGAPCEQGEAVFFSSEDGIADTIRPRLDAMGADVERVYCLKTVWVEGKDAFLNLDKHLTMLDQWLREHPKVRVVVLDPLAAFLGDINHHSNGEVREVLGRLAKVAETHQVAIIAIDHLSKNHSKPHLAGLGSVAFTAAPRAVWQVRLDPEDCDRRLMLPAKMNLARTNGLVYRIEQGRVVFEKEPCSMTLEEVCNPSTSRKESEAKGWLEELLAKGPMDAKRIRALAEKQNFSFETLKNAKKRAGVISKKVGKGGWQWMLAKHVKKRPAGQ